MVKKSGEEAVMKLLKFQTAVSREIHSYKEVTRFKEVDKDMFLATIEPKHNILAELSYHFKDRMPSLNWIIIDASRSIALIHPKDSECYMQTIEKNELEVATKLNDIKNPYSKLWKVFFENISIVFQEVTLFNTSILENIRFGNKNATDEQVKEAARLANCEEFIEKLPEKYNTLIGENGCLGWHGYYL